MLELGFIFRALAAGLYASLCAGFLALAPGPASAAPPGGASPWAAMAETARSDGAWPGAGHAPLPRPGQLRADQVAVKRSLLGFGWSLDASIGVAAAVPFRVFTLTEPPRIVVDLEGLGVSGFDPGKARLARGVTAVRAVPAPPGWARLVFELARPFALETAEMRAGELRLTLSRVGAEEFAARSGPPPGVVVGGQGPGETGQPLLIVIDPGHGGIDPGAFRDGVAEKDVVLAFSGELRAALAATGRFRVEMTRETDTFLPLADRATLARSLGARAFVSVHVNAIEDARARGGIVFTLSEGGSSSEARRRAAVENRADAAGGPFIPDAADPVGSALESVLRTEAQARSIELARALSDGLARVIGGGTQAPLQSANFQVLRVPDVPAALLELGFLSNAADRANLVSPEWRVRAARAIAAELVAWAQSGGPLTRK